MSAGDAMTDGATPAGGFDALWESLLPIGRQSASGGYRRFSYTDADLACREWFVAAAAERGLDVATDRNGNLWAWWGRPDEQPGVVVGSHLDSVPDGGAYDGPLGVVSAFAAVDALRARGRAPARPIGVVAWSEEEGARFGVACAGSRLATGALSPERARALRDGDGVRLGEAVGRVGLDPGLLGRDEETLRRIGVFVELHIEQGRGLVETGVPVGVASMVWPHGRWRLDFVGVADHAGTTRLTDRRDPTLPYARAVLAARAAAERHRALATFGRAQITPNATNAIPARVRAWLDARAPEESAVRAVVAEVTAAAGDADIAEESWSAAVRFPVELRERLARLLGHRFGVSPAVPVLATGAGHDAAVLAAAGIPAAMLFVRNPTGVSHAPAEHAERADCLAGVAALADVVEELACRR